jgi:hypothetical protein
VQILYLQTTSRLRTRLPSIFFGAHNLLPGSTEFLFRISKESPNANGIRRYNFPEGAITCCTYIDLSVYSELVSSFLAAPAFCGCVSIQLNLGWAGLLVGFLSHFIMCLFLLSVRRQATFFFINLCITVR